MKHAQKAGLALASVVVLMLFAVLWNGGGAGQASAGELPTGAPAYKVLAPITHGNLTIFPVVAATTYDTRGFITLDEGLRSGEVVVAESGQVQGLVRRRPHVRGGSSGGAQVNTLVLVNNSDKPLILLAGEIVTGGKQDRVVGKDRIVPAQSDPIDLSVFCVEPGRWVGASEHFDAKATPMAQPSVRKYAMGDKDQQKVWGEVQRSQSVMADTVAAAPPPPPDAGYAGGAAAAAEVTSTSSYAKAMDSAPAKAQVDQVAAPIEHSYDSVVRQLKARNAVGVVVAVNGKLIWADVFASPALLEKYWPKLVRSYATEAVTTRAAGKAPSLDAAQDFLDQVEGTREVSESEPGVFRQSETTGTGYKVFALTSLLPKTGYEVHWAKMAD